MKVAIKALTLFIPKIINLWKKRILSTIGKITDLKTITVSKFIHPFQLLPPPPHSQITKIMFSFIWDGKPSHTKISRTKLV